MNNDLFIELTGYVVLYIKDDKPWVLGNTVYPTRNSAEEAARTHPNTKECHEINGVSVTLRKQGIVNPRR